MAAKRYYLVIIDERHTLIYIPAVELSHFFPINLFLREEVGRGALFNKRDNQKF